MVGAGWTGFVVMDVLPFDLSGVILRGGDLVFETFDSAFCIADIDRSPLEGLAHSVKSQCFQSPHLLLL